MPNFEQKQCQNKTSIAKRKGTFLLCVVSAAEWLRRKVGTRKVPGSNLVAATAYTSSHQSNQLSILPGSVNVYQGYSF